MTYPQPQPSLSNLINASLLKPHLAVLTDRSGLTLEVERLDDIGWSFEVRYDTAYSDGWRQPYTGAQAKLTRAALALEESTNEFVISCGGERCRISKNNGTLRLGTINKNGEESYFVSDPVPFSSHPKPVTLCEQIMSPKVTDLTGRAFGATGSLHFETQMVRFQYPRPTGVVLGLAGQTGELNRNGYRFELYNTDEFVHTPARKPLYQSWPIVFHQSESLNGCTANKWIGIFNDNPSRTFVDIGDFYEKSVTFESISNNSRVYICEGISLEEVSSKMARLVGGMSLPPLWAFGYQQCRWSYLSTNEVRSVVQKMREHDVPLDAIYFDIDYMDGYRVFTKNAKDFGDFGECVNDLHNQGVKAVAIVDPGVKIEEGYEIYDRTLAAGAFLKTTTDEPLPAKVWPGQVILPDFGDARMQTLWADFQKTWLTETHLDGIWNDMNEPSNFDGGNSATSKSVTVRGPFKQESNLYGYNMANTSALGWRKTFPNKRGVIITRSGYPGVQQNAVIWHGDNQTWWEHMRLAIDTAIAYSISGAYYTGPDVPGFTGNPPDDLAVRFFQLGAFLPLYRGHSIFFAKDKEPYAFAPAARELIRDAIRLRYSLLREWYSGFERAIRELRSPIVPVFTREKVLVRDQFLLFDKLLVAPVIERDQTRKLVYLPAGDWYRLGDPTVALTGDQWLVLSVDLESIPIYVRAGSMLTRNTPGRNVEDTFSRAEHQEVYPRLDGAASSGYWYGDDGISIKQPNAVKRNLQG